MSLKEMPKDLFDKINNAINNLRIKPSIDIVDIDDEIKIDFYTNKQYLMAQALYLFKGKDNISKRLFVALLDSEIFTVDEIKFFGETFIDDYGGWLEGKERIKDTGDYLEYFSLFEKKLLNKIENLKNNFYTDDNFINEIANNILDKKIENYAKQLGIDYNKIAKVLVDILDKNIKTNLLK